MTLETRLERTPDSYLLNVCEELKNYPDELIHILRATFLYELLKEKRREPEEVLTLISEKTGVSIFELQNSRTSNVIPLVILSAHLLQKWGRYSVDQIKERYLPQRNRTIIGQGTAYFNGMLGNWEKEWERAKAKEWRQIEVRSCEWEYDSLLLAGERIATQSNIKIDTVLPAFVKASKTTRDVVLFGETSAEEVRIRKVLAYFYREKLRLSYEVIGRLMNRDFTTIRSHYGDMIAYLAATSFETIKANHGLRIQIPQVVKDPNEMEWAEAIALGERILEKKYHTPSQVLDAIVAGTGIAEEMIKGERRRAPEVKARWITYDLLRRQFGLSYPTIGRILNKDHSTVIKGLQDFAVRREEVRSDVDRYLELYRRIF